MVVEVAGSVRARLVYNPSAGMRTARESLERAIAELRGLGWSVEYVETGQPGHAERLSREAAAEGFDVLIAVGGDGTVNEAANGLVDSKTALGVLPLGTANVWAKEMGLPLGDLTGAARLLAEASVRVIDLGEVRGPTIPPRAFILCSGIGFDAAVTREIEPQREMKRRLGALMFFIVGFQKTLSYRGEQATLQFADKRVRRRIILALAANSQLYGGIVRIAPHARVDDGKLNLVVFKGTGFATTVLHLVRVFLGLHLNDPQVEVYNTNCVKIEGKNLPVHVDAEPVGFTPVEIRVRPRSLRVLVPRTANGNIFVDNK